MTKSVIKESNQGFRIEEFNANLINFLQKYSIMYFYKNILKPILILNELFSNLRGKQAFWFHL